MDIVGTGLIAKAFQSGLKNFHNSEWVIFASGVSNSQENDPEPFAREKELLNSLTKGRRIVYFSTCSVNISPEYHTKYIKHKIQIENELNKKRDLVIRLPNVVGKNGNNKNIINYFINSIINEKIIPIQKEAKRNIIGINEVFNIVNILIDNKCSGIYEIGDVSSYKIIEIIKVIEDILEKKAKTAFVTGGYSIPVDLKKTMAVIPNYNNFFEKGYIRKILAEKIKE
ncbi:hypothetical protein [Polynucleobacter sphagniphilus]|uniref:hypothetical protein n=1 Tax=Polynucleobacter sphagniphilus TaxID=1743169 RepID=UPI00240592E7|nr:hypothetical protein [Polynucleobacter sphagniphilus]MDF9787844.1 nucleoside-diphosphate-sugar epimerase [Polynucleobacter sphagniphilus]